MKSVSANDPVRPQIKSEEWVVLTLRTVRTHKDKKIAEQRKTGLINMRVSWTWHGDHVHKVFIVSAVNWTLVIVSFTDSSSVTFM